MIVRGHETVLVQGITGRQGSFWTERMQAYGTKVIGGVNPRKAGIEHCGVPVHGSAVEAARAGPIHASVLFIPPLGVKDAALDAIGAGAKNLCILTEHVPVQDVMHVMAAANEACFIFLRTLLVASPSNRVDRPSAQAVRKPHSSSQA